MLAQLAWFQRLPEILDVLRGMDASDLDRPAVQKLFRVGERRARQLMAGLPGIRAGNAGASRGTRSSSGWKKPLRAAPTSGKCAGAPASLKSWRGRGARSPGAFESSPTPAEGPPQCPH